MFQIISSFVRHDSGVAPVEYALIAAIIAVATTVAASAAGFSLSDLVP